MDSRESRRVEFRQLVRSGVFPVGTVLYHPARRSHPERQVEAVVEKDGLRIGQTLYPTPSAAAEAINRVSTNGWMFWKVRGTNRTLASIRQEQGS